MLFLTCTAITDYLNLYPEQPTLKDGINLSVRPPTGFMISKFFDLTDILGFETKKGKSDGEIFGLYGVLLLRNII